MAQETLKDFFISYTKADIEWAEWIAKQLEDVDYMTIIRAWDFRPGGNFVLEMDEANKGTKRTIAISLCSSCCRQAFADVLHCRRDKKYVWGYLFLWRDRGIV